MSYLFFFLSYFCLFKWCCCRSGHLSSKEAQIIFKAFRLPLSDDLQRALLEKYGQQRKTPIYYPRNISPQHILIFCISHVRIQVSRRVWEDWLSRLPIQYQLERKPRPCSASRCHCEGEFKIGLDDYQKNCHLFYHQTHILRCHSLYFAKAATCTWECLCQGPGPCNLWAPQALSTSKPHLK